MDAYGRFRIRLNEMWESLKIVEQCVERLEKMRGEPIMIADKKIAWPAQLSIGSDGMGNSNEYIKHIMGQSMEALIHHFKLVTEGFRVPPGQAIFLSAIMIGSPRIFSSRSTHCSTILRLSHISFSLIRNRPYASMVSQVCTSKS